MTIDAFPARPRGIAASSAVMGVFQAIKNLFTAIGQHAANRRADAELTTMDPNVLRDIGVSQSDMMAVLYTSRRERRQSYDAF